MSSSKAELRSKNYKRYPACDALKRGSPSSIESACVKSVISVEYVNLREKYRAMKTEYQKSQVKLEQMDQLKKGNATKLIQLTKKSDTINKLNTTITQLKNDIQVLKDTSVNRDHAQRLEGLIKKKDLEIEDLKSQVDDEKPNNCVTIKNLQNIISKLKEQLEYLKEGYGKFNVVDESLKEQNTQYRMEIDKLKGDLHLTKASHKRLTEENTLLKEGLERLKEEHGELTQKQEHYHNLITQMFDSL